MQSSGIQVRKRKTLVAKAAAEPDDHISMRVKEQSRQRLAPGTNLKNPFSKTAIWSITPYRNPSELSPPVTRKCDSMYPPSKTCKPKIATKSKLYRGERERP